jgi:hypothetical protein
MAQTRILPSLPPYGPMAIGFPSEWGKLGREGTVVEFQADAGAWVGNFQPGWGGLCFADVHPNGLDAVVIASGDLWIVSPGGRTASRTLPAVEAMVEVENPRGWVFSRQGVALARLGPKGLMWHTRRISWDGFQELRIVGDKLKGLAWSPRDDEWREFQVELSTGESTGGCYTKSDEDGWEFLAP